MEMIELSNGVYYIPNPANIGIIVDEEKAVFIDTGIDDDTARKAADLVQKSGLSPGMVVNTHSHADHCGGNRWLQDNFGVNVIAPEMEAALIENPDLEPLYLFSGARPIKDLKHKMFKARPSKVNETYDESRKVLYQRGVEFVPLYGHSPMQMGIAVDDILFCADSIFSKETLKRHKIPFHIDIGAEKHTLEFLRGSDYRRYVPSHGEPFEDIESVVDANLGIIESVESYVRDNMHGKKTTSDVVQNVCNRFGIRIERVSQYYLMNTAIMAYLSHLYEKGDLMLSVDNNVQFWYTP